MSKKTREPFLKHDRNNLLAVRTWEEVARDYNAANPHDTTPLTGHAARESHRRSIIKLRKRLEAGDKDMLALFEEFE